MQRFSEAVTASHRLKAFVLIDAGPAFKNLFSENFQTCLVF